MLQLGRAAIVDPLTAALGLATVALIFRWPMSSALIVLGGPELDWSQSVCRTPEASMP